MMSGPYKGGYEEGTPLTVNLMKLHPQLEELSPTQALAMGLRSATAQDQMVEGHDCRNFRRGSYLDRGRGIIR